MAVQTYSLSITELAGKIENIIKQRLSDADGGARMFYQDMLLVGPTDKTSVEIMMSALAGQGITCTKQEFLGAALHIRQKSLLARGL